MDIMYELMNSRAENSVLKDNFTYDHNGKIIYIKNVNVAKLPSTLGNPCIKVKPNIDVQPQYLLNNLYKEIKSIKKKTGDSSSEDNSPREKAKYKEKGKKMNKKMKGFEQY